MSGAPLPHFIVSLDDTAISIGHDANVRDPDFDYYYAASDFPTYAAIDGVQRSRIMTPRLI